MDKKTVAIDLDDTLGSTIISDNQIKNFQFRLNALEVLESLSKKYNLVLWTLGDRVYVDKIFKVTLLKSYFSKTYSWNDFPQVWKDIRLINADFLIDDSLEHKIEANKFNLQNAYIVIPAFGSSEDNSDPTLWKKIIYEKLNL